MILKLRTSVPRHLKSKKTTSWKKRQRIAVIHTQKEWLQSVTKTEKGQEANDFTSPS